jgi:hypothetical protein
MFEYGTGNGPIIKQLCLVYGRLAVKTYFVELTVEPEVYLGFICIGPDADWAVEYAKKQLLSTQKLVTAPSCSELLVPQIWTLGEL